MWLVAPCTELFQDQRSDDTVDLAIGTEFTELTHSDDIDAVLASLRPDATQAADPTLLKKIHTDGLLAPYSFRMGGYSRLQRARAAQRVG